MEFEKRNDCAKDAIFQHNKDDTQILTWTLEFMTKNRFCSSRRSYGCSDMIVLDMIKLLTILYYAISPR